MKPDILAKLEAELRQAITSERQVVYILVELRKLIELNDDGAQYKALKFHCDWAAHSRLKGPPAQEIVRLFDKYQQTVEQGAASQGQPDMSFMAQLGPVLTMSNFRNELNAYLHSQGLCAATPNENDKWADFLKHYGGVIEDCPLRCISQGLRYVDEVVLNVLNILPPHAAEAGFRLAIEWSWTSRITGRAYTNRQHY
jgi:hypothetical protein